MLQRIYTDDGHGDGRFTWAGMKYVRGTFQTSDFSEPLAGPLLQCIVASRRKTTDLMNANLDRQEADLHKPIRETDRNWVNNEMKARTRSELVAWHYAFYTVLTPYLPSIALEAEKTLSDRDGAMVGIALELYHRKHGEYPQSLAALTPDCLPELPKSRFTGAAMRYEIKGGKPRVYSVQRWHEMGELHVDERILFPPPLPQVHEDDDP